MSERAGLYAKKHESYFAGRRSDIIDRLSPDPGRAILEIGCGEGATGAYAKLNNKAGFYVGVELSAPAAKTATTVLDAVYIGNIEELELPVLAGSFDTLIASEVLEHLVDPWAVLQKVRHLLKPGAIVFASSPNVAHKSTIEMLLAGRWDLAAEGAMDRTHLRWFTPRTYAAMFEECGYEVLSVEPMGRRGTLARLFNLLTGHRFSHLFMRQILLTARA